MYQPLESAHSIKQPTISPSLSRYLQSQLLVWRHPISIYALDNYISGQEGMNAEEWLWSRLGFSAAARACRRLEGYSIDYDNKFRSSGRGVASSCFRYSIPAYDYPQRQCILISLTPTSTAAQSYHSMHNTISLYEWNSTPPSSGKAGLISLKELSKLLKQFQYKSRPLLESDVDSAAVPDNLELVLMLKSSARDCFALRSWREPRKSLEYKRGSMTLAFPVDGARRKCRRFGLFTISGLLFVLEMATELELRCNCCIALGFTLADLLPNIFHENESSFDVRKQVRWGSGGNSEVFEERQPRYRDCVRGFLQGIDTKDDIASQTRVNIQDFDFTAKSSQSTVHYSSHSNLRSCLTSLICIAVAGAQRGLLPQSEIKGGTLIVHEAATAGPTVVGINDIDSEYLFGTMYLVAEAWH
ncbi:hypothetical protein BT96DRAFT_943724 [Gymnopus androsaceus JB14]|uniref:Uncharacterized protein n=1 Tax=Gymnopus androsaceus JB14 TaxID=1447944 RepID=A0A6A4H7C6_9AGAR|nr:hypothetical protein BT96DRAFT_943724 [Gymnopus androsaceus JB14]